MNVTIRSAVKTQWSSLPLNLHKTHNSKQTKIQITTSNKGIKESAHRTNSVGNKPNPPPQST